MAETLLDELKRYIGFGGPDERVLRALRPAAQPEFQRISEVFYDRILKHEEARKALQNESQVGHLKQTLVAWMDSLLHGPWDADYYERRARIGRKHVRIALPQHYMLGAMNVIRQEFEGVVDRAYRESPAERSAAHAAIGKILDLELAIMLHTYREDLLSQQARVERLSTFGQLVGSIGHELRNPLGVMESSLYILKGRLTGDERAAKHVGRIQEQISLANDIITKLLDMIRDRPLTPESVDLNALLQGVVAAANRAERDVVTFDIPAPLAPVAADAVQLGQVFSNLVENAVQATGAHGRVRVRAARVEGGVEVRVEDDGPGVDPSVRARLFEPLITTKAKGIGLGLALVKRIVERHGGSVRYQALEPSGACFVVRLPA